MEGRKEGKKMAGRVAQVVEHLPSKCEMPSSNPSTIRKKNIIYHAIPFKSPSIRLRPSVFSLLANINCAFVQILHLLLLNALYDKVLIMCTFKFYCYAMI
jgi:hypothetical protein